jgi:site-specific DNA-methyltransferase (adenine-specific)
MSDLSDYPFTQAVLEGRERWALVDQDCLEFLALLPDNSVDAVITDPPAAISFMAKAWDSFKSRDAFIKFLGDRLVQCLRVLKPGGHAFVWALPRTSHYTALAIENAGFEIRDRVTHVFGTGYNKSQALLKPAAEDWWLARKPFKGTLKNNLKKWGVGQLNLDACRISTAEKLTRKLGKTTVSASGWRSVNRSPIAGKDGGRVPANFILSHNEDCKLVGHVDVPASSGVVNGTEPSPKTSTVFGTFDHRATWTPHGNSDGTETVEVWECTLGCPVALLNQQSGKSKSRKGKPRKSNKPGDGWGMTKTGAEYDDEGGASRFYYVVKPSPREKEAGLEALPNHPKNNIYGNGLNGATKIRTEEQALNGVDRGSVKNTHPTVKSITLMRYLSRLVIPPNGLVIDPFAGSGSTGCAALLEGFRFIGIEIEAEYRTIAMARLTYWEQQAREGNAADTSSQPAQGVV